MADADSTPAIDLLPDENWRPVPEFPGYEVSDMGRVCSRRMSHKSRHRPIILKTCLDTMGYESLSLYRANYRRTFRVCVVVARAFLGPLPEGQHTRHLDGNKGNNRLDNLAYGTPRDNYNDRIRIGDIPYLPMVRKLTEDQVREIRSLLPTGMSKARIGKRFSVSESTIRDIAAGRDWAWIQ